MNILAASLISLVLWALWVAYYEMFLRRRPLGSASLPPAPQAAPESAEETPKPAEQIAIPFVTDEPEEASEPAAKPPVAIINSKGKTYYPHARLVELRHGVHSVIYYFAKDVGAGALTELPAGYVVAEAKNYLPILRKTESGAA